MHLQMHELHDHSNRASYLAEVFRALAGIDSRATHHHGTWAAWPLRQHHEMVVHSSVGSNCILVTMTRSLDMLSKISHSVALLEGVRVELTSASLDSSALLDRFCKYMMTMSFR